MRTRGRVVAVLTAAMLAVAFFAAPAEAHRRNTGALIGGLFGAAILGTMIGTFARPYDPPRYVYVEPPPAYYVPPPVPPYPPVPVYPAPNPYSAQPGYYYAPAPIPPAQTAAQRLEELQDACRRGFLTKQECDAKRKAIIEGM